MINLASFLIILTAVLHLIFFKLESLDFMKRKVRKSFGLSEADAKIVKIWALNQGYYNLFLAIGLFYSAYLLWAGSTSEGRVLAITLLSIISGAGAVLYLSKPKLLGAACIQALPAILGLLSLYQI